MSNKPLHGKVAVVEGATRGAGRGIAMMLGEAGSTVYVTGRSVRGNPSAMARTETIEETAELVNVQGGIGIPARVDHTDEEQVKALFERVRHEQNGRLDILINDIWGVTHLLNFIFHFGIKHWIRVSSYKSKLFTRTLSQVVMACR